MGEEAAARAVVRAAARAVVWELVKAVEIFEY